MANPEEVHNLQCQSTSTASTSTGATSRTRRTGLLTVMERPPGKKSSDYLLMLLVCSIFCIISWFINIVEVQGIHNWIIIFSNLITLYNW